MNIKQKLKLKKLIKELESIRGRHTELVSVYIPKDYELIKVIQHLQQEQGTAANIKDARTRKNVIDSLEKMIRHLRLYKKTPPNGLGVFAGNASKHLSKVSIEVWSVEPPEPLNFRLYRCDQTFMLDPLKDMLEHKETYGLIVLDRREGNIGLLKGNLIKEIASTTSNVPGKTRAGGQCCIFSSLIQSASGSILKIEDSHNPINVKSVIIGDFSIKDSPIVDKWVVKKTIVYKVITTQPRLEIQTSKDHVFFVSTNDGIVEKSADQLNKKDYLLIPEVINVKGRTQKLNSRKHYNSFGISKNGRELINKKRLEKNLFQRELAKNLNVTQTAISIIELGKRNIKRGLLKKLCIQCGINFKEFLNNYTLPYKQYGDINLPKRLDSNFAQFIGYLIGDGCIEKDRISFFEQNKEVAFLYKKKFDKYFNINSSYRFRESKNYHQLRFTSRPLVRLIKNEFPEIKKSRDSMIPQKILISPNKILSSFLQGLFDAEGFVSTGGVELGMNNKILTQQIQMALLRFNIISSFTEYDNHNNIYSNNPIFKIRITDKPSLINFYDLIGFSYYYKNKQIKEYIRKLKNKNNFRQILLSGKEIKNILMEYGKKVRNNPYTSHFYSYDRMRKNTFKRFMSFFKSDKKLYKKLEEIYNIPLLPVKISKIQRTKKKINMIDISVKNQSFIANGLIVHNSAARYARIRQEMKKEFFKRVGDLANKTFLNMKELKGILVGGPVPTKEEFADGDFLNNELKKKIIAMQDLGYTGEFGLNELVDKSKEILEKEEVMKEKKIVIELFELLRKEPGKVAYGKKEVLKALEMGAIEKLLISENLPDDEVEELQEKGEKFGAEVHIISVETREGVQLRDLGGYAAILRYALK